jgi:hypothetical protein
MVHLTKLLVAQPVAVSDGAQGKNQVWRKGKEVAMDWNLSEGTDQNGKKNLLASLFHSWNLSQKLPKCKLSLLHWSQRAQSIQP